MPRKPSFHFWTLTLLIIVSAAGSYVIAASGVEEADSTLPAPVTTLKSKTIPADKTTKAKAEPIVPDYQIPPIEDGLAPVLATIPTEQKVVFLGIDDGSFRESFELQLLKQQHIKASLYLGEAFVSEDPSFFKDFVAAGSLVENHTVNHVNLTELSYEDQQHEICAEADLQEQQFGRRPVLFRPPGGDYNEDTRRAAADCGMKAVVLWIAKANGGEMQYQIGDSLRPGDIVLMHFRPEFADDLKAFVEAQKAAGLQTDLLENWLPQ